eukprot:3003973-Pleurochrysis_carterae.AAC.2
MVVRIKAAPGEHPSKAPAVTPERRGLEGKGVRIRTSAPKALYRLHPHKLVSMRCPLQGEHDIRSGGAV